ncbi:hypothetical protein PCASD_06709 [Puccinia coronata f. sp. avenae]|uniref:CxC1-like cysteine cluster associated with KDZ transposases domain-containing protein n=1 Tax=Puccinia coronata f. sp. avenae TaxID=200324 RepID=A0A2N5TF35_9BASI|nr:hypothetical protein PCASD_15633 [Puccinia coronata f. sp. avenae]PLW24125.1 hypothetical protein PCASD_06709 [Puccinia coronata f. sp. avenae]
MTRPIQNARNRVNRTISTGSTRRRRTRRTLTQRDIAEQNRFDESIQSGRRARVIPSSPRPIVYPNNTYDDPNEAAPLGDFDSQQHDLQDNVGSRNSLLWEHATFHRLRRHAENREKISQQWSALEQEATATYLLCQERTNNWTVFNQDVFEQPHSTCSCTPEDIRPRNVDLIDILHRQPSRPVHFCQCTPDTIRLIHCGYFAASADTPRTAFSIQLIQLHHFIWQASVISTTAFVKGLSAFLDTRSNRPLLSRSQYLRKRNLRIPFSFAVDLFSRILAIKKQVLNEGLALTTLDQWADKCPRCFGPQINENKAGPAEPDFIIALDGNFQQRHYAHASKDNPSEQQYPPGFVLPSRTVIDYQAVEESESLALGINPPCSDVHKAANDSRDGSTWDKCDDSGLFASACRHDAPLLFVNIYKSGEKLYYPIAIIRHILQDFPGRKVGVLYDLGCHLETHIKKRGLLADRIGDMIFGTSVFHAYVHEWACQVKYNPRFNPWWGLSDGEGLERLWSFLSSLVSQLRVTTRLHRLSRIQARADYHSDQLMNESANWLSNKLANCQTEYETAKKALDELHLQTNPYSSDQQQNYTNEFLEEQWELEQRFHRNPNKTLQDNRLELGRLLSVQSKLEDAWRSMAMTPEQAVDRARTLGVLTQQIEEIRGKVGSYHLTQQLTRDESELLLKVWYYKTKVRGRFLSLIEERQPLLRVRRGGDSTTLGTRGQQKLIEALRKHADKIRTVLATYNDHVRAFTRACPNRPPPPQMEYTDLLNLQPDDPFWNDGTFTNANEAWAVDPLTQRGIRTLAYFKRAIEERRRLGWETRRSMRWAIDRHNQLKTSLTSILQMLRLPHHEIPEIACRHENLTNSTHLNALEQRSFLTQGIPGVIELGIIIEDGMSLDMTPMGRQGQRGAEGEENLEGVDNAEDLEDDDEQDDEEAQIENLITRSLMLNLGSDRLHSL